MWKMLTRVEFWLHQTRRGSQDVLCAQAHKSDSRNATNTVLSPVLNIFTSTNSNGMELKLAAEEGVVEPNHVYGLRSLMIRLILLKLTSTFKFKPIQL